MTLQLVLESLRRIAMVTPEYEGDNVGAVTDAQVTELLQQYPSLVAHKDYLEFLRMTGGAHIRNARFSLGVYGFGGYVVPSLNEELVVEDDRYFNFGDVLYEDNQLEILFFWDIKDSAAEGCFARALDTPYFRCADSFTTLLQLFANGHAPGVDL